MWGSVAQLGMHYQGKISNHATMRSDLNSGKVVILNVHNGGHWVLATSSMSGGFHVNDPGYNTGSYTDGQVVQAAIYTYTRALTPESEEPFEIPEDLPEDTVFDYSDSEEDFL